MIERIDQWLRDVGTQRLVDGDRVRDMLLDLRLMAADKEMEVEWHTLSTPTPGN